MENEVDDKKKFDVFIKGELIDLVVLDEEFAEDKTAKENSQNATIESEKRESISLKSLKNEAKVEEAESESDEITQPAKIVVTEKIARAWKKSKLKKS